MINRNTHIREFVDSVSSGVTVLSLIKELQACIINNPNYEELRFETEVDEHGDVSCSIYGIRPKTDEELQRAAEYDARMKELRRQQYEYLKKEFEE